MRRLTVAMLAPDRDVYPGRFTSPVTELDSPVTREGGAGGVAAAAAGGSGGESGESLDGHSSGRSSYDLEDFE